jgi:hypothetical protein
MSALEIVVESVVGSVVESAASSKGLVSFVMAASAASCRVV